MQHHPFRAKLLPRLLPRLEGLRVEVVEDPEPLGWRNPWRTYRECLTRPWDGTHLLIVQDDAMPCEGFAAAATAALVERPDVCVAFFAPGTAHSEAATRAAAARGERWALLPNKSFIPVVATCWPREHALAMPAVVDAYDEKHTRVNRGSDDGAAYIYCSRSGLRAWATVPSLVEHPDDVPSLIGKRHMHGANTNRVAAFPPA